MDGSIHRASFGITVCVFVSYTETGYWIEVSIVYDDYPSETSWDAQLLW